MSIIMQQIGIEGNNTKYLVNYNNKLKRNFIVPNDKKDEFVNKYPRKINMADIGMTIGLIAISGLSAVGGSALLTKLSKNKSSVLAKYAAGIISACIAALVCFIGKTFAIGKVDQKLLEKYGVKEIKMA